MPPTEPTSTAPHLRADGQPDLTQAQAQAALFQLYGLSGRATPLPGDRDQNFKMQCGADGTYVLKIFHPDEDPQLVAAQARLFPLLNAGLRPVFPTLRPTLQQRPFTRLPPTATRRAGNLVWLAHFMPGAAAAHAGPLPQELLYDIGALLGGMDAVLAAHPQPAARRPLLWAPHTAPQLIGARLTQLPEERRPLLQQVLTEFQANVGPLVPELRLSLIHNDVNDHNLLLQDHQVSAILDFGDMLESYTVCELAHAAAYLMLDSPAPHQVAAALAAGYHAAYPLRSAELASLFDLIRLRLALSVTISAYQQALRPSDPYLRVSEAPAWRLLERLTEGAPARQRFTEAILQVEGAS